MFNSCDTGWNRCHMTADSCSQLQWRPIAARITLCKHRVRGLTKPQVANSQWSYLLTTWLGFDWAAYFNSLCWRVFRFGCPQYLFVACCWLYCFYVSLIYDNYLANVHYGDIPHTFIPRFNLLFAEKIRIEFICKLHQFAGVPQTRQQISAVVGPSSPYYQEEVLLFHKFFFPIVDTCLSFEDMARQSCVMVPKWHFCVLYFQRAACSTIQTCILNSH